jgi:lysozyme family protein
MGSIFEKVVPFINVIEGGHSEGIDDFGGETKYGISKREFPQIDIPSLTFPQACAILEENYWRKYRIYEIENQQVANQVFLLLINMNPLKAGRIIQKAINACGSCLVNIKIDGVLGSKSIWAINLLNSDWLMDRIRVEECRYYLQFADENVSQQGKLRGWIRRALT